MKTTLKFTLLATALVLASAAQARDTKIMLPIAAAMSANDAQARLGDDVKFHFAGQPALKIIEKVGAEKTSQRTNSFGKSAETACNWVFLSALLQMKKRAQDAGANAVVNIVSNYNNVESSSATEFECHEGAIMAGVALKGEFARVKESK